MFDLLTHLFDTSGFPPRWQCGAWSEAHGWLHILSDLGIWSAYFAIPCILVYFIQRRQDVPFRAIFWLFGAFILACGTTHLMEAAIFWWPAYRLAGGIKLLTAIVSWATIVALVQVVPKALVMRTPEELEREVKERTAELSQVNETLRTEISDRRRAEEEITRLNRELQSRADELQTILDLIPIGVAIAHDPECRRITHNPYLSELLNVPAWENASLTAPENERPTNFTNLRDGKEIPSSELPMQVACTGTEVRDVELDLVCRGRDPRKMLFYARPLFDEQGRVRGSVGACLDITSRKQVEEALRQSEQRFARFMQYLPGLAWIKDLQGRYVYVNDAAEQAFRAPRAKLYGKTDEEVFPPELATLFKENDRRAMESGANLSLIENLNQDDGERCYYLVNKFTIMGTDGKPALLGGMAIDINDRLRAEKALKEADRRKDEFLAILAHELRNPLAPIRNALELIKGASGNGAQIEQACTLMERQVGQMVRLIDDLLDLNRISRGKVELRKTQLELATAAQHAIEVVRPHIEAKFHELTVSMPPNPLYLDADPTRLSQIIANLLNNSTKYTEAGGHIWLTAQQQGGEALISVRDTGIGIASEHLPHIFEMFAQFAPALERSQGGLGVGLALVKGLVELHGGAIEARSDGPGMGSEFIVRLPIAEGKVQTPPEPIDGGAKPRSARTTCRILVVDDNRDAADSLAMILQLKGHEIQTAYDGVEAVQAAATFRPDVVLLDIGMPRMNGYEAAQHIQEQSWGKKIVLVALTGWGQEEDKRRAIEAGLHFHLTKPVELGALDRLLEGLTQLRD